MILPTSRQRVMGGGTFSFHFTGLFAPIRNRQPHVLNAVACVGGRLCQPNATHGQRAYLRHGAWHPTAAPGVALRFRNAESAVAALAPRSEPCGTRRRCAIRIPSASGDSGEGGTSDGIGASRRINMKPWGRHGGGNSATSNSDSSGSNGSGGDGAGDDVSSNAAIASAAVAASVAAAAVAGAIASAAPPPPPRATALGLLQRVVSLLRSNILAVLMLYGLKDGAAFLLHRVTQRLTNHAAAVLLGIPTATFPPGNPWWLYLDPAFIRAHPGYELLIGLFFLACLPFTIALNSLAFTIAALICSPEHLRKGAAAATAAAAASSSSSALPSASPWSTSWSSNGQPSSGRRTSSSSSLESAPRHGVGGSLYLPPDDPAAAALADLGIHALPTAPPPLPRPPSTTSTSRHTDSAAGASPPDVRISAASAAAAAAATTSPFLDDPPATVATISAAASLAAEPPLLPSGLNGDNAGGGGDPQSTEGGPGPWEALRTAVASVAAVLPEAGRLFHRVWWVDLHFNARALPLQGMCLLVIPALWALPRLLRIQLALPTAVLEARAGRDALDRSSNLMTSSLAAYGMPFAGLLAVGRLLEYVQSVALVFIPPRWWREVVEVPLLIAGAFLLLKAVVHRLQDLLPLAAYLELSEQEAEVEAARKRQQAALLLNTNHQQQDQQDLGQQVCKQQQQQQQQARQAVGGHRSEDEAHTEGGPVPRGAAALPGAAPAGAAA